MQHIAEEDSSWLFLKYVVSGLFLLTFPFFLNFLSWKIRSPFLHVIEGAMGLDHTAFGSLFFFISVGCFIAIMLSSIVYSIINQKNTIALSTFCSGNLVVLWGYAKTLSVFGLDHSPVVCWHLFVSDYI